MTEGWYTFFETGVDPQNGYLGEDIFEKDCQRLKEFSNTGNGQENHIVLYKCEAK